MNIYGFTYKLFSGWQEKMSADDEDETNKESDYHIPDKYKSTSKEN